jgi:hypothetical protein
MVKLYVYSREKKLRVNILQNKIYRVPFKTRIHTYVTHSYIRNAFIHTYVFRGAGALDRVMKPLYLSRFSTYF